MNFLPGILGASAGALSASAQRREAARRFGTPEPSRRRLLAIIVLFACFTLVMTAALLGVGCDQTSTHNRCTLFTSTWRIRSIWYIDVFFCLLLYLSLLKLVRRNYRDPTIKPSDVERDDEEVDRILRQHHAASVAQLKQRIKSRAFLFVVGLTLTATLAVGELVVGAAHRPPPQQSGVVRSAFAECVDSTLLSRVVATRAAAAQRCSEEGFVATEDDFCDTLLPGQTRWLFGC